MRDFDRLALAKETSKAVERMHRVTDPSDSGSTTTRPQDPTEEELIFVNMNDFDIQTTKR